MHNKHAEEAERIITACKIGHVMSDCRFAGCMCFVGQLKETITQSLHSAVQKEREDIIKEIEALVDKEKRHLEKDTDHEYIDTCRIYKKLQKLGRIDRIKSDREKGDAV